MLNLIIDLTQIGLAFAYVNQASYHKTVPIHVRIIRNLPIYRSCANILETISNKVIKLTSMLYSYNLISQLLKLCVQQRRSIINSYLSPQFKYMIFHLLICIFHIQRVYFKLTKWPAPRWLDSSVSRALRQYRRGHCLNPVQAWIFFRLQFHNCLSCVCNCDDQS